MEKAGTAAILYMTGTGNTARAAGVICKELADMGWGVRSEELRKGPKAPRGKFTEDLLVLCFPTLGFGMPALVRSKLRALRGKGKAAAVFATWGGEGRAALWQARGFLARRGFRVAAAGGGSYPYQWTQMVAPPTLEEAASMVSHGDGEARRFGAALAVTRSTALAVTQATALPKDPGTRLAAAPKMNPRNFLPVLLGLLVAYLYSWIGRQGLGAMYAADSRCKACGKCVTDCPAGAISMAGAGPARRPRWTGRCQGCNRCINLCARGAVQTSPFRAAVHLPLNVAVITAMVFGLSWLSAILHAPAPVSVPAFVVALVALIVFGSRLQFRALEPLLFALESRPAFRALIGRSWTARFPRYKCEGFTPARPPTGLI
jgi:ferredoxin